MALFLLNGKMVLENGILAGHHLMIGEGKIKEILADDELKHYNLKDHRVIDVRGGYICPGFIDIHCHGAVGYDVMDGDPEGIKAMAKFKATQGVTGFIPTAITNPYDEIEKALKGVNTVLENEYEGARILGFHLEGPFINPEKKGAHRTECIVPPDIEWTMKIKERVLGKLIITVAPEMPGAIDFIKEMGKEGILIGIGHSNGTYSDVVKAYEAGATHGIHTFNGMRGLHHREPGVVGGILDLPLMAEIIADGIHLHPVIMGLIAKIKLPDQLTLITDAMRAAGLGDGEYDLGGLKVYKRGKEARLEDGTLAGSTLTMGDGVKNLLTLLGLSVVDVIKCASTNPAKLLGLAESKGSIAQGKDADLTLLTSDYEVMGTIVGGKVVYSRE